MPSQPESKVKRMNLNVEVELHRQFKAATAAEGLSMTDALLKFIDEYVRRHGAKPKGRSK